MPKLHIDDITISYQGQDLSQFGLFPLIAWYFRFVVSTTIPKVMSKQQEIS